jgi:hypothetical protein
VRRVPLPQVGQVVDSVSPTTPPYTVGTRPARLRSVGEKRCARERSPRPDLT